MMASEGLQIALLDDYKHVAQSMAERMPFPRALIDQEPLPPDHPLRTLGNAVITPHIGYVPEESYRNFHGGVVEAIAAWRSGAPIRLYPSAPNR